MNLPSLGPRGEGWLAIQIVLLVGVFIACFVPVLPADALQSVMVQAVGVAVFMAGSVVLALGIRGLGDSLRALPRPKADAKLVEDGIYGLIRNPIYAGLILIASGASSFRATVAGLAVSAVLAVFLDLKARREEVWLREKFPDYADYANRVKRFVPRIY
jgi:protein-S-isoprenylcysteine O-methyltransferase Ste14